MIKTFTKLFMLMACIAMFNTASAQADGNITFTVDMSEYTGSFTTAFLSGTFNGWGGGNNPMTDNGDGTWTTTVMMTGGQQEYKFQLDEWADDDTMVEGDPCTITTDGFTNRVITVDGDATLDVVCFSSCFACGATSLSETELASVSMESFPNPADQVLNVQFETPVSAEATLNMTDVLGRTVQNIELGTLNAGDHTERLDVSRLNAGVYVLTLQLDGQIARTQNIVIQ